MLVWLLSLPDRVSAMLAPRPVVWRALFAVALLVALAYTTARYLEKVKKPSDAGTYTRTAFLRWKPQVEALFAGENIYDKYQYPNPPVMAVILRPFMRLPSPTDAVAWLLFKMALAAVGFVWVFRLTGEVGTPLPPLARAVATVLAVHPILGDLSHGNVNIFIAFLVFACLELFRRGHDLACGLVLALAIACKVTPALFVPYFGWKAVWGGWTARRHGSVAGGVWRGGGAVLAGCAVGLGLWLFAVPAAVFGWERNTSLLASWYDQMVRPFLVEGKVTPEHANQSIPGLVHGFFTPTPLPWESEEDGKPPKRRDMLIDLGSDSAKWMVRGCQLAFVAAVFFLCRAPTASRQGVWRAAECALVAVGMLLFSERTWKHHATTLVLPMAALVGCWVLRAPGPRARAFLLGIFTAAAVLMNVPSLLPERAHDLCLVYGTHTAAFVLLAAGVCGVLWGERRDKARHG